MTPWSCPRCSLQHLLAPSSNSPTCSRCEVPLKRVHDSGALVEVCDQEHGEIATTCADCGQWICLSCKEPCPASKFPHDLAASCTSCSAARAN